MLGSILLDNEVAFTALEMLTSEDFYRPAHQVIFRGVTELTARSEPVDTLTLSSWLREQGLVDAAGGLAQIVQLVETVPTSANVKYYAETVRKKSVLRRLIQSATEIVKDCYDSADPYATLDNAEKAIFEVYRDRETRSLVPVSEIVAEAFRRVEKLAEEKKFITGVSTGITSLDYKLAGLQPSDLIIVAGRPSMGKTAFALGMGLHASTHENRSVAVFSLEMSKESLVTRMLCSEGRIDSARMRGGTLTESDWPKLARAAGRLSEARLFIDDGGAASPLELRSKCRRLAADVGLDLVIVDYLQLMKGRANTQSREQEISEISRGLKALAKELKIPVVALSQLNRSLEQRTEKRPVLADLRESGAIEQDADVIMFIYRDEVYNPETEERGIAEIIVGKQRNGPVGTVRTKFFHEFTRFENLAADQQGGGPQDAY